VKGVNALQADWVRLHAIVEGRVQGVGFRYFVLETAEALGVTGWVRNRWDDTVEVMAEGERPRLEKLLSALQRGPRSAFVSKVDVDWLPATGEFRRFGITQTY
jgi:acylphosphatase